MAEDGPRPPRLMGGGQALSYHACFFRYLTFALAAKVSKEPILSGCCGKVECQIRRKRSWLSLNPEALALSEQTRQILSLIEQVNALLGERRR